MPESIPVWFSSEDMLYARRIAKERHETGGRSKPLDSGGDPIRGDLVGVMGEMAVCMIYGLHYRDYVTVYSARPGAIADIVYKGYTVSVKGRERFDNPELVVPDYDDKNDIYILVSVAVEKSYCEVRGWITKTELMKFEPQGWKWAQNRPGAKNARKRRRYVPLDRLRQCRPEKGREKVS